jgi:signal transduction histidine kinase
MWQRLAHKTMTFKDSVWLLAVLGLFLFSACSSPDRQAMERLNSLSYAYHYRNIDSVEYYASAAKGTAEGLNNLAFVKMVRMDYQQAEQILNEIPQLTDNQIELLVCYVQQMRLCQRRSRNKDFHDFRERSVTCMKRIDEERNQLDARQQQRLRYAETEFGIVNSTYYYYVGLERQSIDALMAIDPNEVRRDTAQFLNYLYNMGAGGIITEGSQEDIYLEEMDCLTRCLTIAQRHDYPYFEAQAKESLADHTGDLELAEEALQLFEDYGDIYQIAGAHRTLPSCYHAIGDDEMALEHLNKALSDTTINQAPDLVASIREQLSVAYAAMNDKAASDYNRNLYLDLQEQTRQDRELESRAAHYDKASEQLNWMLIAVVCAIVLLLFLLWLFNYLNHRSKDGNELDDVLEQKSEEVRMRQLSVEQSERRNLDQRAKVSVVVGILPLIDRIRHEVKHLESQEPIENPDNPENHERLDYIREVTDKINEQNDLLTTWIQLRRGELNLHIESFPLQPLFDIVGRSRSAFDMKGVSLSVEPTDAIVKADRVLTLFMLNTLADNARKFTDKGGSVTVSATEQADYVELSVADTGCGMTDEQLAHAFDHKVTGEHGFGLMNCKGIIEKYRKMSQLFSVCQLSAESEQGRGSRFFFRLPKGKLLAIGIWLLAFGYSQLANSQQLTANNQQPTAIDSAHVFADSAYFCNVNGQYERTLLFADSCRAALNRHYLQHHPHSLLLMTADGTDASSLPAEIEWLHDSVDVNYQIILDIRNESAVAALALHEWPLYIYNNKVYTQLFKELSADNTLADYCRVMQQSQSNKRIAMILLIVILLLIVPAYYMMYYRHRLYDRHRRERMQLDNIELADDELRRAELEDNKLHVANNVLDNCLSALKHETMYYPSRIRQLVDKGDVGSLDEVTQYYRELYGLLSTQAVRQVEQVKLHVSHTTLWNTPVLGNENLLRYLAEILRPQHVEVTRQDDRYVVFTVTCEKPLSDIDYLRCRQIIRDHGDATHRRACGITVTPQEITITLPTYNNGQV